MTVKRLIKQLEKLPPEARIEWVDALGNWGYIVSADPDFDDKGLVLLNVRESKESFENHQI